MRTEQEVRNKLVEKEFSEQTIEEVIIFLHKYHYIDDEEYAIKYIKERQRSSPRSGYVIGLELKQRGIAEEVYKEILSQEEIQEEEGVMYWLLKKTRGQWPPDEKKKQQLYGFLQRKGYNYSIIKEAFVKMDCQEE